MRKLLIATSNRHKFEEYVALLGDVPFEIVSLADVGITDEVAETGTTFRANAQLKAEGYSQQSGLLTLADDSGLEIFALKGAPGVYSARYGGVKGDEQLALVLKQLENVEFHERMARFVCVIAITAPDQPTQFAEGTLRGVIDFAPKGTYGFGYDPIFYLLNYDKTLAELPPEEKNKISHRAQAFAAARTILEHLARSNT